jgi:hypothetical protein
MPRGKRPAELVLTFVNHWIAIVVAPGLELSTDELPQEPGEPPAGAHVDAHRYGRTVRIAFARNDSSPVPPPSPKLMSRCPE